MSSATITGTFMSLFKYFQTFTNVQLRGYVIPKLNGSLTVPSRAVVCFRSYSKNRQMPKKDKSVKSPPAVAKPEVSCPVCRDKNGFVTITVHAKPGAKHSGITDVCAEAVGVSIAAPPSDGEANCELVRFMARVLELKKSNIALEKGSRSRDKLLRVESALSPEEVLKRLRQEAAS